MKLLMVIAAVALSAVIVVPTVAQAQVTAPAVQALASAY
jgi:hypothetical protein